MAEKGNDNGGKKKCEVVYLEKLAEFYKSVDKISAEILRKRLNKFKKYAKI